MIKTILAVVLSLISNFALSSTDTIVDNNRVVLERGEEIKKIIPSAPYVFDYTLPKKDIKVGERSPWIAKLNSIYKLNGSEQDDYYSENIEKFVKQQQNDAGLTPNGVIDAITWMNLIPFSGEIMQQWQQSYTDDMLKIYEQANKVAAKKWLVVNIPTMTLISYEYNAEKNQIISGISSKVIIGKTTSQTPMKPLKILSIKYNPDWKPTKNMIKRNVFKGNKINTKWIKEHNLTAYDPDGYEIELDEIIENPERLLDWDVSLVQTSGNDNALGVLKLETDSKDNIYLHDTNERYLFKRNIRNKSSGCIRVEKYKELAKLLTELPTDDIESKIEREETRWEKIKHKTPVYFTYHYYHPFNNNKQALFGYDVYNKQPSVFKYN